MKVAYLVSGYPRNSHTFIRREIKALESFGVEVLPHAQRPLDEPLVTEADREEYQRTRVLLSAGMLEYAWGLTAAALRHPGTFLRALVTAVHLGNRSERGVLRYLAYLAEAVVLERWLRGTGVSHLHAHFGNNATSVALLCHRLGGPPFSFTVHLDDFDNVRAKVIDASFVVAISSFGRSQLYRRIDPGDWAKVREVHCGVDGALLATPQTPVPAARRLVCVARLHPDKGHLLLLEAAARLAADGLDFEIVLAGDGPFRGPVEERIRALKLERQIKLAGWMSEQQVRQSILDSRALVLPSFNEGLPVSLMEALALGRPVIGTAIAGIPELVIPHVNGWLIPAGSVDALTSALREVLQAQPAQLEAMGRAGAALVAERHDAGREAGKLLTFLRAAVGEVVPLQPASPGDESAVSDADAAILPRSSTR